MSKSGHSATEETEEKREGLKTVFLKMLEAQYVHLYSTTFKQSLYEYMEERESWLAIN